MEQVAAQISKELIEKELEKVDFIRPTNNGNNEIYIFKNEQSNVLMQEVGRLREISFRDAGGGTGHALDIDDYDIVNPVYSQLIVWDPQDKAIIGGYRFILCDDAKQDEKYKLSTEEIFTYSDKLKIDYFPKTLELGRSWVQPNYQPKPGNRSGLFSLDNLWDGLGALIVLYPKIDYFFGKITMYTNYNPIARDYLLSYMHSVFPDNEKLVSAETSITIKTDCSDFIHKIKGLSYKESHGELNTLIRDLGERIPPLFNSYMNLSASMKTFPTCINSHFGDVEETGILIKISDIYDSKKDRHVNSYLQYINKNIV